MPWIQRGGCCGWCGVGARYHGSRRVDLFCPCEESSPLDACDARRGGGDLYVHSLWHPLSRIGGGGGTHTLYLFIFGWGPVFRGWAQLRRAAHHTAATGVAATYTCSVRTRSLLVCWLLLVQAADESMHDECTYLSVLSTTTT